MKRSIFTFIGIFLSVMLWGQTTVFQEDFEGTSIGFTSSSVKNNNSWSVTSSLASQGLKSDSATVGLADTTYLTSSAFSCANMSFVQLEFDQIAKLEYFDAALIEVSSDNGANWDPLTATYYLGNGQFSNSTGNKFNATSYVAWIPGNNNAVPDSSWWKHETFNISALVADSSQVKIRFVLIDANSSGAAGNYGWLIDDVKVTASFSELIPPTMSIIPPYPHDTAYTSGPFNVKVAASDASGLDTIYLVYHTSTGVTDTLGMNLVTTDTFSANIPFYGFGRSISYYVKAVDASPAANADSVGTYTFFCKYSPGGTFVIGTGTNQNSAYSYPAVFGQYYTGDKEQYLIPASELQAAGAVGGLISSIAFDVFTANSATSSGANHTNFTIKMKNSTATALTSTFETGLTQVYTVGSYQTTTGWNTFNLQTPFVWDGSSSLVVEVCFDNYNGSSDYSSNTIVNRTSTTYASASYYRSDNGGVCPATSASTSTTRPNMSLEMTVPTSLTNDIGVINITNPTGGVVANTAFPVKVKVKNFGVDTITSGTVNWKLDGVSQTPLTLTDTLMPGSISGEKILGTKTVSGGSHFLLTWTDNPNGQSDFNVANDSASIAFYACPNLLNGTYTIGGTNPDYTTFADAVLALNQCGINGPVTFNVAPGTYNEQINLNIINGSSLTNNVVFKAANGDSSSVILKYDAAGTVDNFVVKLNGTAYVTFQNMTFQAEDSTYCNVFAFAQGAHDIVLKNNVLKTLIPQATNNADGILISTLDSAGVNIEIAQNLMKNAATAVSLNSNTYRNGWKVNHNTIESIYSAGINLTSANAVEVIGNSIQSDSNYVGFNGIAMENNMGAANISANKITTTATQVAYGIVATNSAFDSTSHAKIYNNMILLNANSSGSTLSGGLLVNNAKNIDLYYNTVHMVGNQTTSASLILYDNGTINSEALNIKNNIFTNHASGYIAYIQAVDTADFVNDYNVVYNWNQATFAYLGAPVMDFSAWKTVTGNAMHSDTIDPYYISASDIHVANNLVNGIALPIAGITTDIDGETRNATNPDVGADEFTPSPYDITALEFLTPVGACGLDTNELVTMRIKNIGSASISGNLTASYKLIGATNVVTENVTATINPGDTLDYVFAGKVNVSAATIGFDTTFVLKGWVTLTGDNVHQNDTTTGSVASGYVPPAVVINDDTINYGAKDTLMASGMNIYWWASDTTSTELWNDSIFITPNLFDTTTYWVSDRAGIGQVNVPIGNGTNVNGASSYPTTYGNYYWGNKEQYLILASELQAMGIPSGPITSISFDVDNVNSCPALAGFELSIGTTTSNSLTAWQTGLTTVFSPGTYTPVAGINTHTFTTPFIWDGTSNIVIQMCSNNSGWVSSGNAGVKHHTTTFNGTINTHADQAGVCNKTSVSTSTSRPNMILSVEGQGCFGQRTPVTVYVTGFPSLDAGIDNVVQPTGSVPGGTPVDVKVKLTNYGQNPLTSTDIFWTLNGVLDSMSWTGNLAYTQSETVIIDTAAVFNGGQYNMVVWSQNPNSLQDTINSNDTAYVTFNACMNGTYTIGDTINGNADFGSFTGAIATLNNAGICGHVVFNVDSGSYVEQLVIPEISGMDANNTVTFQSASGDSTYVSLEYSSSSYSNNYTLKFDGGDYFTFKNMNIKANGTSYGGVIEMGNGSNHISFLNNIIETTQSSSSYMRGIYSSGGDDDFLTVENNHVINGYYAVYLNGSSSSSLEKGIQIKNNLIEGFVYYGIYTRYSDSVEIIGNKVMDGTNSSYGYGIYMNYSDNEAKVLNNVLELSPNNYKYGIYINYCDATASGRGLVANNMVNITDGTSSNYGIYFYYSSQYDIYYNTVNITSGSSTSRGASLYGAGTGANINFANNIIRDSVGYSLYAQSTNGLNTVDYNSYYSNSSSNFAYWSGAKSDLAALQAASSKDAHSLTVDPLFVSATDLHMLSTQLSGMGTPVTAINVDIDGETRNAIAPTIGADEVPLLPYDVGTTEILYMPDTTLENQSVTISAVVRNFGTQSVSSFGISYSINNGTPVVYNYTTAFAPAAIDTVQLATFNSPAGNSSICVKTVLAADSNYFNDEQCKNFFGIPTKDAEAILIQPISEYCGMTTDTLRVLVTNVGIDTINAPAQVSPTTISFRTNNNAAVTETFTSVVAPGDTVLYEFNTPVYVGTNNIVDSIYNISAWISFVGDNVTYNDSAYTVVNSLHQPALPTVVTPVTVPYGSPATLSASSTDTIVWYRTDTSFVELGTGGVYVTPYLYANDSFYVAARAGFPGGLSIHGTGSNTSQPLPVNMYYGYTYSQSIYPAANFGNKLGNITKIAYYYNGNSAVSGDAINIYMGTTNKTAFDGSTYDWEPYSNLTLVYSGTLNTTTTAGWIEFTLTTPFNYEGNGNLVVGFDENTAGYHGSSDDFYCTQVTPGSSIYFYNDTQNPDPMSPPTSGYSLGVKDYIPNTRFAIEPSGCPSNKVPVYVNVGAQPANDMGVISMEAPTDGIFKSTQEDVTVKIKNFGTAAQSNFPVSYVVNNGTPVTETVSTTVNANDTLTYTFTQKADLSTMGNTYDFKAYTSLTADANALNDTTIQSVEHQWPNYCISKANYNSNSEITNVSIGSLFSNSSAVNSEVYTNFIPTVAPAYLQIGTPQNLSVTTSFTPTNTYNSSGYMKVYVDYNRNGDFSDPGEEVFGASSSSNGTVNGSFTIPNSVTSGTTAMRIVHRIYGSASSVSPCGTYSYGETEDYLVNIAPKIPHDAGVELFNSPTTTVSAANAPLNLRIRNYGTDSITSVDIKYTVNGGSLQSFTYNTSVIQAGDSLDVAIGSVSLNMGANVIKAYTVLAGDTNNLNDTLSKSSYLQAVLPISFVDDFESTDLWMPDTIANQWERGVPNMTNITSAHSPSNVWAINLDTTYANNSQDYLYTPQFIIPNNADSAYLKFWHFIDVQSGSDGGYIQFRVNSGFWAGLGYMGDPQATNWFDTNIGGTHMWSSTNSGWQQSKYTLDFQDPLSPFYNADTVQFRFVFYSNGSNNSYDGWAIDDFEVSLPQIPNDGGVIAIDNPGASTQTGSSVNVTVKVKNFGTAALSAIPVAYDVNNSGNWVSQVFPQSPALQPGDTAILTFTTSYTSPNATYSICAKTTVPGDVYVQNDQMCKSVNTTPAPDDAGATMVTVDPIWSGNGAIDSTKTSYPTTVKAYIKNYGSTTISSVAIEYAINSGAYTTETYTGSIPAGDSVLYTFTAKYTPVIGNYILHVRTNLSGDADISNDMSDKPLYGILDIGFGNTNGDVFSLEQNMPNPAHGNTSISYFIPKDGQVRIELRNTLGQLMISNESHQVSGRNTFEFDADKLANGVYYYTVEYNKQRLTRKMVVNK